MEDHTKEPFWDWLNLPSLLYVNSNLAPRKKRKIFGSLVDCSIWFSVLTDTVAHCWWEYLDLSTSYEIFSWKSLAGIDLHTIWMHWFAASLEGTLFPYNLYVDSVIFLEFQSSTKVKFSDTKVRNSRTSSGLLKSLMYEYQAVAWSLWKFSSPLAHKYLSNNNILNHGMACVQVINGLDSNGRILVWSIVKMIKTPPRKHFLRILHRMM